MGKKRTFKVGEDILDIPVTEVEQFLTDVPEAKEVQSFVVGKDTLDIPIEEVEVFKKDVPEAKPLYADLVPDSDTIPIPSVTHPDTLPDPPQGQTPPDLPTVEMDKQGNISQTVQIDRKQRDAILNSAFRVPEDIRRNPVFGRRYVQDVARKMNIPEPAAQKIYEQGVQTFDDYNALKANYDIGKGTDEELNTMGQMLLSMGRYDEALQAYKKLEGNLMNLAIKEYQPGMRQDYIDQRQAPAFIGILNAVHAKGDMKEYERLLRIAQMKGIDLSGIPSVGDGSYMQDSPEVQSTYGFSGRRGTDTKPTPESEYLTDIANTMQRITPGANSTDMALHGLKKISEAVKDEYLSPWKAKSASGTLSNNLAVITGLVETLAAALTLTTGEGGVYGLPFEQLSNYSPESVNRWMMWVSELVRRKYDGNPPKNAENLAVLGDFLSMAIVGGAVAKGAKGISKNAERKAGINQLDAELMESIESMPDEQIREMFSQAEKRFEATGNDPVIYAEQVRERTKAMTDELKAIEESLPAEPYNPEPAPNTLRTVAEGVDVEYKGERGVLDRGDDGTWYFTNDEGKSTQIPVEDKFNPTETLTELELQVLPEISKDAVARAVADAEQVGEVEYKGKKYFVSLDNPMKDSPTGDLVFERTADGRLLNRFDSHPDPAFAANRKLAIANKFLADKGLPPREKLIEPWKEKKTKEPATPVSAEAAPEGAVTPEGASAIMPEPNLQEGSQVQIQESLTPKENAGTQSSSMEVVGDQASRTTPQVAEGAAEKVQEPAQKEKKLSKAEQAKRRVRNARMVDPVDLRHAILQYVLGSKGGSISLADANTYLGYKRKEMIPFLFGKKGRSMHSVWESMKTDPATEHLIPDNDHDFNNAFFDIISEYGSLEEMWADLYKYADDSNAQWREMGFPDKEAYERELAYRMELAAEGIDPADIPQELIDQIAKEVDQMPDEAVEQMLKDLDENAPEKIYEEQTDAQPEPGTPDSKAGGAKGEDLADIAREQQQRDIAKAAEEELKQAQEEYKRAAAALEEKRKDVDQRIAQEQQQELFDKGEDKNPLQAELDPAQREAALQAEKLAFKQAQEKLSELQGQRKQQVLKKIDEFEQWALNLPGIKDMSGGAEKAGIGAAEVIKGITEVVRKAVEAGFDIADAVSDAIEKYKRIAPEFFEKVSEKDIRDKFGVSEQEFRAANETSKKLRERLGIPQDAEFTAQNRRDVQQVVEGAKKLKEQGVSASELIDKVIFERHMLSAEEQQFLVNHEMDLFNERREIEKKLNNISPEEINRDAYVNMYQRLEQIIAEQGSVLDALERAGSEQSLVFRMRQLMTKRDYSVENFERSYKARMGKEPDKKITESFQRKAEEIVNLQDRIGDLEVKKREAELQGIIDGLKEELERERTRRVGKPSLTQEEVTRKKELANKFRGMFNDITNIASMLADKEFYEYAGLVFKEARADFQKFSQRMIEELGEKISPHLQEVYDKVKRTGTELPEMRGDRLWIDVNLLKNLVAEGVKDHTELTAKVLEIVRETIPEATERQVQEAITGYGKTINPSLDPINRELSMLKRDMKLAISLEDAKAGLGVKRSGYQPEKLTPDQREMMRKIREELKNYPQDAAEVERKWRTALDRIKSGLKNAIEDTKKRIDDIEAGRAVETKQKKVTQLDNDALLLKEQLADLKKRLSDLEGPKQLSAEQLVNQAIAAAERSRLEYERKADEIRRTGTFTSPLRPKPSSPALDLARAARDRAKQAYEAARATTDLDQIAATSKALSVAEKQLQALQDKTSTGDVSYRQRLASLADINNPALKAVKESIKQQQDILKAMREASGEADRHAVELWKRRKQNRIKDLNERKANNDFSLKEKRVLPIDQEMIRLKAEESRAKFEYDVAFEIAMRERMSTKEKIIEQVMDWYEVPRSIMASFDVGAIFRQGSILGFRHPVKYFGKQIPDMVRMMKSEKFYNEWHDQLALTDDYISAKESKLDITEPNAKLTAREELAASKIASKIPGIGMSNRAYSGLLNMQRMQAFVDFKNACLDAGITGSELKAELKNYATFINEATGRGKLPKLGQYDANSIVPLLNVFLWAPKYVISRANLMARTVSGFHNFTPRARIAAYKAMGAWAVANATTLFLAKELMGLEINTDDPTRADYMKVKIGSQQYDLLSGFQQMYTLINRLTRGYSTSLQGEMDTKKSRLEVLGQFARSKSSPMASYAIDALLGKTYSGEKFDPVKGITDRLTPMSVSGFMDIMKQDGAMMATINTVPIATGIGVQTIDLDKLKKESELSEGVMDLMKKANYYPKQTSDQEVYVNDKPYQISDEQLERIREIRNKYAGKKINQWFRQGDFKGKKQVVIERMWNDAYNLGLEKAYDEVLPKGWSNEKQEDKSKLKILQ